MQKGRGLQWFSILLLLALVSIQIGFGTYGVVLTKFAKHEKINSLVFSLMRDACCAPILFTFAALKEGLFLPDCHELPFFFILGLFGMFGNQFLYIQGLYFTTTDIASSSQPLIPVLTYIFATMTCMEPLPNICTKNGLLKVVGLMSSVTGAIFLVLFKGSDSKKDPAKNIYIGYLCLFGNCSSMGIYLLLQKRFIFDKRLPTQESGLMSERSFHSQVDETARVNPPGCTCLPCLKCLDKINLSRFQEYPATVTAWSYIMGAVCMGLASTYFIFEGETDVFTMKKKLIIPLSYSVLVSSAFCYALITWCNKYMPSTIVSGFWPLQVLVAVILSYFVFDELMTVLQFVGGGMIIIGLLCITICTHIERSEENQLQQGQSHYTAVRSRSSDI